MTSHSDNVSLFYTPVEDKSVQGVEWVEYGPVGQLNSESALEFTIPGNSAKYIDLRRTLLKLQVRIKQADGENLPSPAAVNVNTAKDDPPNFQIPPASKVAFVNMPLQTMWRQVDVSLQQQVVSPNISTLYPYKAMFKTLLGYGGEALDSQLQSQLFFRDGMKVSETNHVEGINTGLTKRGGYTEQSKIVELEGPILCDITEQSRYLLNGVQVNYKLWPSSNAFKLLSPADGYQFKIEIVKAILKVCMLEMAPEVVLAHAETLKTGPAKYFYDETEMRSFAIATGEFGTSLENIFQGYVPRHMVVGFVLSEAFMGAYNQNPFNFQHFDCSQIALYVDGVSKPTAPLTPNFEAGNYLSSYVSIFGDTFTRNSGLCIDRDEYSKGRTLFAFDLCLSNCNRYSSKARKGHTRLDIRFAKPLSESVTVVIMSIMQGLVLIDEPRNVIILSKDK